MEGKRDGTQQHVLAAAALRPSWIESYERAQDLHVRLACSLCSRNRPLNLSCSSWSNSAALYSTPLLSTQYHSATLHSTSTSLHTTLANQYIATVVALLPRALKHEGAHAAAKSGGLLGGNGSLLTALAARGCDSRGMGSWRHHAGPLWLVRTLDLPSGNSSGPTLLDRVRVATLRSLVDHVVALQYAAVAFRQSGSHIK